MCVVDGACSYFLFTLGCVSYAKLFRLRYSHKTEHPTRDFCIVLPSKLSALFIFYMIQRHGGLWLYMSADSESFVLMLQNLQIEVLWSWYSTRVQAPDKTIYYSTRKKTQGKTASTLRPARLASPHRSSFFRFNSAPQKRILHKLATHSYGSGSEEAGVLVRHGYSNSGCNNLWS